jgi:type VI secretion system protein ImpA
MPSPEILDFDKLLAPLNGEKPTGADLRADSSPGSAYYAVKDARSAARNAERQMVMAEDPNAAPPDWKPVLQKATQALAEKTKDLEITAYLIEALVRLHGFPGLRDGFRLAREMVEQYWDDLYPVPDEDGMATRVAPLTGLNGDDAEGTLISPIAQVPLTDSASGDKINRANYQEALALAKITDPEAREKKIAGGTVSLEKIQQAVDQCSTPFFVTLVEDVSQCQEEFANLCTALDQKCSDQAPPSSNIREALTACLDAVKDVARNKLPVAEAEAGPSADGEGQAPTTAADGAGGRPGETLDVVRNREDAFRSILKLADFFRRTEPHTPISFALEQVVRWGRMDLPALLTELLGESDALNRVFKQVGIRPPGSES